jgi:hypothetical protein
MSVIKDMDEEAFKYLDLIDPMMWSRHAFSTANCTDMLLNNIVETFNARIMEARVEPILTIGSNKGIGSIRKELE